MSAKRVARDEFACTYAIYARVSKVTQRRCNARKIARVEYTNVDPHGVRDVLSAFPEHATLEISNVVLGGKSALHVTYAYDENKTRIAFTPLDEGQANAIIATFAHHMGVNPTDASKFVVFIEARVKKLLHVHAIDRTYV